MRKIEDVETGCICTDGAGEYAKVRDCCHGNPYYGYMGNSHMDQICRDHDCTQDELDKAIVVSDMHVDHLACC